jgi:hypothetical protein
MDSTCCHQCERSRPSHPERGESNFIRKMLGFYEYHGTRRDHDRWGIPNFYVLTVTPTRERALNLCRALADPERKLGLKRFWFTNASHVSLETPAQILEKIFFTPKDYAQGISHSVLA